MNQNTSADQVRRCKNMWLQTRFSRDVLIWKLLWGRVVFESLGTDMPSPLGAFVSNVLTDPQKYLPARALLRCVHRHACENQNRAERTLWNPKTQKLAPKKNWKIDVTQHVQTWKDINQLWPGNKVRLVFLHVFFLFPHVGCWDKTVILVLILTFDCLPHALVTGGDLKQPTSMKGHCFKILLSIYHTSLTSCR